ncbi:MAG: hypothetical protein WC798_01520 [Candidatus Paceibacterota bacterium]|jgi:hypothetical protein
MRRILIIAAILILLIGVGAFVYFYFFTPKASLTVAPNVNLPLAGQGIFPADSGTTTPAGEPTPISARLVKISVGPVVPGEAVVNAPAINASSSPETLVHYIERQSGNVFSYSTRTGAVTRTNNQTIPGIQSAAWVPDAKTAFVRYLSGEDFSTINTYALPARSEAPPEGFFLPQNISALAVSSAGVLTLVSGVTGSVATLSTTNDVRTAELFSTPLSALRVSFAGKSRYLAYTKPAATLPGAAFLVDDAGRFSRIAGPLNGLVALASPSGKWALVSYVLDNALQLDLVDTETGDITSLPVTTIVDKCVWAADDSSVYCGIPLDPPTDSVYPDDWYQGAVQFSDRIWKIEVEGRYAQLVLDFPEETGDSLDATALAIDPDATTLVFLNKNDDSLWSYSL